MIPKQTPVRNFRSATCRFTLSFPQGLSWEGKLCAYHLPLKTCGFQTAQRDIMTCIAIICGDKAAPAPPAVLHCPRHLPSRLSRKTCHRKRTSVPPGLPLPTYRCRKTVHGENALYRNRLRLHGAVPVPPAISRFPAKSTQKKRSPVRGFSHICVWRDSNPRPSESESDALSSCATNTKYPITIPCFAPESKAIFYPRLFRLCSAGFS